MFRKVLVGVTRHGRKAFEKIFQKGDVTKPGLGQKNQPLPAEGRQGPFVQRVALPKVHDVAAPKGSVIQELARYARKNLASELRRQYSKTPVYREYSGLASKLSLFAFVGVGFSSKGETEQEHFSSVCDQIKSIFSAKHPSEDLESFSPDHGLHHYQMGPMIAKGCNAAVYQATEGLRASGMEQKFHCSDESDEDDDEMKNDNTHDTDGNESDIDIISEDDDDNLSFVMLDNQEDHSLTEMSSFVDIAMDRATEDDGVSVLDESDSSGAASIMFVMTCQQNSNDETPKQTEIGEEKKSAEHVRESFDLAIKMMFNYDTESNASALYRQMRKEMIPAKVEVDFEELGGWENGHRAKEKDQLPPHPNIVDMRTAFVDEIPWLPGCETEFPDALPQRLNPGGFGRNKTLFLVMKRYPKTLRDYLKESIPVEISISLLAQLVEAVLHMEEHGIAHRDLKSDNIFVDDSDSKHPQLVVSDFGECLCVDPVGELKIRYFSEEISKGGNAALMAPEIITACCGPNAFLDYRKADLWTVGALAYEIFGLANPFYRSQDGQKLSSGTYREGDLPPLHDAVPQSVQHVIKLMLQRDPEKRPSPREVSTMLHLILWGPTDWGLLSANPSDFCDNQVPGRREIMRWLLILTARTLCEKALGRERSSQKLQSLFLGGLDFEEVMRIADRLWKKQ